MCNCQAAAAYAVADAVKRGVMSPEMARRLSGAQSGNTNKPERFDQAAARQSKPELKYRLAAVYS